MKYLALTFIIFFSSYTTANNDCSKVVSGYEKSDSMYVICDDLSSLDKLSASDLIINLFNQYQGEPDEIIIYFVKSKELLGKHDFSGNELTGFYYTHSNKLEISPNSKTNKKVIEIEWK